MISLKHKTLISILVLSLLLSNISAMAGVTPINKASEVIQIDYNTYEGKSYAGFLTLEGTSSLERFWVCLQGPAGELATYPVISKASGQFTLDIFLRFGAGTYYILASDNPQFFDGTISVKVINTQLKDTRFISPSAYVDSNNPSIQKITTNLITPQMNDHEKLKVIHNWVINNLSYDIAAYLSGRNELKAASVSIQSSKGLCRDYAFVLGALVRAAGIPVRIVYGQAGNFKGAPTQDHAWNEVYLAGQWVSVDSCWNAGFFAPDPLKFKDTHKVGYYTNH